MAHGGSTDLVEVEGHRSDFKVTGGKCSVIYLKVKEKLRKLEMWANAQRDGRPAEHSWRPLFNAAKFG